MEVEERPSKLRKLDHEETREQNSCDYQRSDINAASECSEYPGQDQEESHRKHNDPTTNKDEANGQKETLPKTSPEASGKPMSKNQLKKLRRKEQWEAGREDRKAKRKEKLKEKKERQRAERDEPAAGEAEGTDTPTDLKPGATPTAKRTISTQLPLTFLIDCGFDDLMSDNEIISLASQVTRCYSANSRAPYHARLMFSSFNGRLRNRFETVLSSHHKNWKGVQFLDDDFVASSERANEGMSDPQGGKLAGCFSSLNDKEEATSEGEVVYLTSDSPDTLEELKPYSTYIIGGLVDRNRHKGICYKRAMGRGVKTAKLPIGKYMEMNSRFVLATNHVIEIMVKWLESRDWAEAFMAVVPKRKGGSLKEKKGQMEEMKQQEFVFSDDIAS